MAMIESEFLTNHFENLVQVIVSAAPIPAPTFPVLGADRLVASLSWSSLSIVAPQAGLIPPPGFALARAALKIGHASIAELTTNAAGMPAIFSCIVFRCSTILLTTAAIRITSQFPLTPILMVPRSSSNRGGGKRTRPNYSVKFSLGLMNNHVAPLVAGLQ